MAGQNALIVKSLLEQTAFKANFLAQSQHGASAGVPGVSEAWMCGSHQSGVTVHIFFTIVTR